MGAESGLEESDVSELSHLRVQVLSCTEERSSVRLPGGVSCAGSVQYTENSTPCDCLLCTTELWGGAGR